MKRGLSILLALLTIFAVFTAVPASAEAGADTAEIIAVGATESTEAPATEATEEPTAEATEAATDEAAEATEATEPATEPVVINYPVITGFENASDGAIVRWDAYEGAYGYRVYYKNKSGGWTRIYSDRALECKDTSVKDAETRVYTVRALDKNGNFVSDFNRDGWSNTFYAPPVIKSLENIAEGVKLTWKKSKGTKVYRVYRKYGSSSWTRLASTDKSEYTDKTAVGGRKYSYTLRIVDEEDKIFLSGHNSGKSITFVAAPVIKKIENTEKGALITWDKVPGADFYRVYCKNSDGGWTRLASKYLTEYTDTTVKDGTTRVYTLRCLNDDEEFVSGFNSEGWSNLFHAAPVISSLENTVDGVKVTWKKAKGVDNYRLYRKTGTGSWKRIVLTKESSYTDKTVVSGKKYTYTLRMTAEDGETFISGYNSGKSITFVAAPVIKSITNTDEGALIKWDKVAGADFYRVYYKNSNGGWTRLASKYLTEYTDTSVKDGTTRVYTLRCLNNKEEFVSDFNANGWSNKYYAAPTITSVSYSGGNYKLGWKAKDSVAGYRLYRKSFGGSWARLFDKTADTSYTDKTAKKGTLYAYTIRYLDADGNLISGFLEGKFYKDGKVVNGNVYINGTYGFKDGYLMTGLNRVDGKLRYYNGSGRMYRDTIVGTASVGYYYTDPDGVCCESEEMRLAAEFMVKYCKGSTLEDKAEYAFLYLANNYPYVRVYDDQPSDEDDISAFAIELFTEKQGTCYRYAAAYACICKIAGYRSRFSYGISGSLLHGWTEVYVDGEWLICDVDAQLPSYGYDDYAPYMMEYHMWTLEKYWSSELTIKDGKAIWGSIKYY